MRDSKREFISLAISLGLILALVANLFHGRLFAKADDTFDAILVFTTALDKVQKDYVREVGTKELVEGALSGMLNSLDPHSSYIPPRMLKQLKTDTEGEFEGVGMELTVPDRREGALIGPANPLIVRRPFPGTPAFRSGIIEGDRIMKVDGETTTGMTIDEAVEKIKGPRGTKVVLTIDRMVGDANEPETFDVELVREKIPLYSVRHTEVTEDGIGYIGVADFKEHTADELKEKIGELEEKGMKALVLDLRYNPGGLLKSAAEVADLFLPKGDVIVSTKGRRPEDAMNFESEHDPILSKNDAPMAVLVNGYSASASEIVTGALQENGRAIVVGSKTYGKGSVQTVIELQDDSALRLTTAYFYTPRGAQLSNNGIDPDIKIALSLKDDIRLRQQLPDDSRPDEETGKKFEDVQLNEAITVLRGYVILARQENDDSQTVEVSEVDSE